MEITVGTMPNINLYIFELVQNSLDCDATEVSFTVEESRVSFLHNGHSFGETDKHVRGMSNIFQSTKTLGSIGFMGFGFKTAYKRFTRVDISDTDGWRFYYDVSEREIKLTPTISIYSRDWLGAVVPKWDSQISPPAEGFTTKFTMQGVPNENQDTPLLDDWKDLLRDNNVGIAILSLMGLKKFTLIDDINSIKYTWELSYNAEESKIYSYQTEERQGAELEQKSQTWFVAIRKFIPSDEAIKSLSQSRLKNILANAGSKIHEVWGKIKKEYTIYGLVSMNDDHFVAAGKGTVFATFPLNATVPFDMHMQADWLLDLSRKGLREVQTNPWQQCIFQNVAVLLANFLKQIPKLASASQIASVFDVLHMKTDSSPSSSVFDFSDPAWIKTLRDELEGFQFIPVKDSETDFPVLKSLSEVYVLPHTKQNFPPFSNKLFGRFIVDRNLVNDAFIQFMVKNGLMQELDIGVLTETWKKEGLANWWDEVNHESRSEAQKQQMFLDLWSFLVTTFTSRTAAKFACVLSVEGKWICPSELIVLEDKLKNRYDVPLPTDPYYAEAIQLLEPHLPKNRLIAGWMQVLIKASGEWGTANRFAYDWLMSNCKKQSIEAVVTSAFSSVANARDDAIFKQILGFTGWLVFKNSPTFISHVIARDENGERSLVPASSARLSSPYISDKYYAKVVDTIYGESPKIVPDYIEMEIGDFKKPDERALFWRDIFEALSPLGDVKLEEFVSQELGVAQDYKAAKHKVAEILSLMPSDLTETHTTIQFGWKIKDTKLSASLTIQKAREIGAWLRHGLDNLRTVKPHIYAEGYNRRSFYAYGPTGSASWVKTLASLPWIQDPSGEWRTPATITKEDAGLFLGGKVVQLLGEKGLVFKQ
eukprot:TRINITY_DN6572_c0_g1_i1.p1 TRINITY_DN6572_c0_g1~~TRINITY_DN6572_c0_g1_i1.p1  ORF type:complete len:902 (-),score=146.09 TRINITY_DN6572_c0_g1_i1:1-2628(-)